MEREDSGFRGGFRQCGERACSYCGSSDIVTGLEVHQNGEAGRIGLPYKAWKFLVGTERFYADLCRSCGTVLRLYVKEPDRTWIQDKELRGSEPCHPSSSEPR